MKTLEAHKDPHKEVSNQLFCLRLWQITTKSKSCPKNVWEIS